MLYSLIAFGLLFLILIVGGIALKKKYPAKEQLLEGIAAGFLFGSLFNGCNLAIEMASAQREREMEIHQLWHNRMLRGVEPASEPARPD